MSRPRGSFLIADLNNIYVNKLKLLGFFTQNPSGGCAPISVSKPIFKTDDDRTALWTFVKATAVAARTEMRRAWNIFNLYFVHVHTTTTEPKITSIEAVSFFSYTNNSLKMTMYIRLKRKNQTIFLHVEPSNTFAQIKHKISEIFSMDASHIMLFANDKVNLFELYHMIIT